MMLNEVHLIGRVGGNPERLTFRDGSSLVKLSVATSERWRDKATGEMRERTEWHAVRLRGKLAEIAERFAQKGSLVYVAGSIRSNKWTDQAGVERVFYSIEVGGYSGRFLVLSGGKREAAEMPDETPAAAGLPPGDLDDEIPF